MQFRVNQLITKVWIIYLNALRNLRRFIADLLPNSIKQDLRKFALDTRGDVPGWVLVVLMTTALVTAIWTIAQPRLSTILRNSLDSMNNVR